MRNDFEKYADEIENELKRDREEENRPLLTAVSAKALQGKDIPPLLEVVPGLIVQGLTILGAPPKYGKSWLMLALCLSAAEGEEFLGYRTRKTGCLYLALEDSERRLRDRMNVLLQGDQAPEHFYSAISALSTDTGLIPQLEGFLENHPETGLIVIDTLQKIRGSSFGRDGSYAADYRELGVLKSFADKHRLALILVHHLRKMGDETDPFNRLSGTAAIAGAADAMIVLSRDKRSADTARLNATGRDIEETEIEIQFQKEKRRWVNLGRTEALAAKRAQEEYEASPIVKTVRKLVEQSPGHEWKGTASQLMEAGRYITGRYLAVNANMLGKCLPTLEERLLNCDGIQYSVIKNGNGGKSHIFRRALEPCFTPAEDQMEIPF